MQYTTDGLILREVAVGDNDKMLTILIPEYGQIGVMAKGAKSIKRGAPAATELYTYGNFEIYEKNDRNWLRSASVSEGFFGLRNDIVKISLAAYLADLALELTGEGLPSADMLKMTLNAFFAIATDRKPCGLVKAVYELRAACFSGYMPDLSGCRYCKCERGDNLYIDVMNGCIVCSECMMKHASHTERHNGEDEGERSVLLPINGSVLAAIRYAVSAPGERMLSFSLKGEEENAMLSKAAEEYLLHHLERGFASLEFYKTLLNI